MDTTVSTTRRQVIAGATALGAGLMTSKTRAAASSRSLLILGDWGRDGAFHQADVARQMDVTAGELDCAGVIAVGDNFYEDGVKSVSDPKWQTSFEDVYSGPNLRRLRWYAALGNHDYGGNPQAQVEYSRTSDRWTMPARYYKVAGSDLGMDELDLFVIDTNPLIGDDADGDGAMAVSVRAQSAAAQLDWLDKALAQSQARFKLVAGHHTIYSGGILHGDTPDLIVKLMPILHRHAVTAYINGHDHDLQHIKREGMHFICSGAGSQIRAVSAIDGTQFCLSRSGFGVLTLREHGLALHFRDFQGTTTYQTDLV